MSDNQRGENNGFYGMNHSDISKESISIKNTGNNHPMYGKKHSRESLDKMIRNQDKRNHDKLKESCQVFNKPVLVKSVGNMSSFYGVATKSFLSKMS